jgi:predicted ATPase
VLLNVAREAQIEFSLSAIITDGSILSKILDTFGVKGADIADDLPELQLIIAVVVLPYTASDIT